MLSPSPSPRAPLLWLVLPLAAGIAASGWWSPPPGWFPWLLGGAGLLAAAAAWAGAADRWPARCAWALTLGGAAALAGLVHAHVRSPKLAGWEGRPAREVRVTVEVSRLFALRPDAKMLQGLGIITDAPEHLPELQGLRVYFSTIRKANVATPARHGVYVLRGVLSPAPRPAARSGFEDYLANLGVAAQLQRAFVEEEAAPPGPLDRLAARAERRFAAILRHGLEKHPALQSIHLAMLLGEKAALTPDQEAAFMRSGTFHVFSVSGLHVGVIAGAIQSLLLLLRAPRVLRVGLGLAALWFYVLVVGANPPAVRAFIMIVFLLARGLFGLPGNPLAALSAAALATLLLDPRQLFSSGFQLSYLVVGAIVLMGLPLAARWHDRWRPFADLPEADWRWWWRAVRWSGRQVLGASAITLAALLGSTPATIAYFGLFTPGGLLANLVVLPLASLAIVAGFVSILAGLGGLAAGSVLFNHAAALLILVMDRLVRLGVSLPLAWLPAGYRAPWLESAALAVPLALMLLGAQLHWRPGAGGFWLPVAGVVLLLLACVRLG